MQLNSTISIKGLRLWAHHGVLPMERLVGNDYTVSVNLVYPPAIDALTSDDLQTTLNYAEVVEIIKTEMSVPSNLLEHVAGRIYRSLLAHFPNIESGSITVAKLAPPIPEEMDAAEFTLQFNRE